MPDSLPPSADAVIRAAFPDLAGTLYLDTAARGPLPAAARRAAEAMLRAQAEGDVPKQAWFDLAEGCKAKAARLLGCGADEIAFTKNASEGINIIGAALRLARGDRVVVAPAIEHPNNIFPWLWRAENEGATLVRAIPAPGQSPEEAIIAALDERTRLVAVTTVDFASGRRTDIERLGAACRARDIFLLVDAAQSSGVLAEDLARLPIDGYACAAQKGLLGLYGLGLLYVNRAWLPRLRPAFLARFSVVTEAAHEAAGPDAGWRLHDGAARFEIGNPCFIGIAALDASLDLLLAITPAEVERRALGAAARLRDGIAALDIPVLPLAPAERAHILAVGEALGEGHDSSDTPWIGALSAHLKAHRVVHSVRRGILRLATHIHVLPETTDAVLAEIAAWARHRPA